MSDKSDRYKNDKEKIAVREVCVGAKFIFAQQDGWRQAPPLRDMKFLTQHKNYV